MSSKAKKTGLGVDSFFGSGNVAEEEAATSSDEVSQGDDSEEMEQLADVSIGSDEEEPAEAPSEPEEPSKPPKYRTTVMLYPDTLSNIELLKSKARKEGVKATMSDILNDAIELLAKERQIQ